MIQFVRVVFFISINLELEIRQQKGSIPKETDVLAVVDPIPLIGSGGATLNALLLVAQHLSIKAGLQVLKIQQHARLYCKW